MNFTELLLKHDLEESEYKARTERNHGVSISQFRRECPLIDWISAAFPIDWSTNRLRWHAANREWIALHS